MLSIEIKSRAFQCQVCRKAYSTPVDLVFDFRCNDFLAKCIREHDTQSVIWALARMRDDARPSSFIFAPQTELSRAYPEESGAVPDRELDLLCVIDGKVVIGEVKSTPGEIGDGELGALAALAVDIRPDVVVVAAVKGDETQLARKVETLRTTVSASIEVRGICGSERNSGDELFLPKHTSIAWTL